MLRRSSIDFHIVQLFTIMRFKHFVLLPFSFLTLTTHAQVIKPINPPTLAKTSNYSHAVVTTGGRTIYVSGQVSQDKNGNLVGPGDFRAQATQAFENVRIALEAAGGSAKDIVKITTFMTNMDDLPVYREIRKQFLKDLPAMPASTTVEVSRLFQPGYLLEVEVIAIVK